MMLNKFLNEYENEIREILDALHEGYFDELDQYSFDDDVLYPFRDAYKKPFKAANGATKGVLIFPDFGFVIKIPFIFCDGDEMCGAQDGVNAWDYCSQEACRYEMAEEEGFGDIFLETDLLDTVNNHPIYIQPYAEVLSKLDGQTYDSNHRSGIDVDRTLVKEIDDAENYTMLDSRWEVDLLVKYGIEIFKKFKKYLKDNWINDLRDENIGYVGKNPVLIDYAGFDN